MNVSGINKTGLLERESTACSLLEPTQPIIRPNNWQNELTSQTPGDKCYKTSSNGEYKEAENLPHKLEYSKNETIREWWIGKVTKVHHNERYFEALLKDVRKGIESIAEFDFDSVFQDTAEIERTLFPGANFAFFVITEHGRGSPLTISRVEFSSPHIWEEDDNEKVKELFSELFPYDDPLK